MVQNATLMLQIKRSPSSYIHGICSFVLPDNVNANHMRIGPKKKLGRGRWYIASWQVSLNSIQQFQRRSQKCLSKLEAWAAILVFRLAKKHKIGRPYVEILLSVKFCWILFKGEVENVKMWRTLDVGEVENVSSNQRPGGHLVFRIGPKNTKLVMVEDAKILRLICMLKLQNWHLKGCGLLVLT